MGAAEAGACSCCVCAKAAECASRRRVRGGCCSSSASGGCSARIADGSRIGGCHWLQVGAQWMEVSGRRALGGAARARVARRLPPAAAAAPQLPGVGGTTCLTGGAATAEYSTGSSGVVGKAWRWMERISSEGANTCKWRRQAAAASAVRPHEGASGDPTHSPALTLRGSSGSEAAPQSLADVEAPGRAAGRASRGRGGSTGCASPPPPHGGVWNSI